MGHTDNTYKCVVDQIIIGVDQIGAVNYQRAGVPAAIDPRRSKVRFASEQMLLHLDILFAKNFFRTGVWANEFKGIETGTPGASQFLKFSDANFDPVNFFDQRRREIKLAGRREPNKLSLGYDAYIALKNHPDIIERVKYSGSTVNPAVVNANVLAQLLGFEEVKVLEATYNKADEGQEDDMQFVCESDGALLTYTTNSPQIDEPSAGYIFTWDMLGNGNYMATDQFEGEPGTHSEFIEGLMSTDMKKTSDDLACYLSECVQGVCSMSYLCKKQIRLGGTEYNPGEIIPDGTVLEIRARTLKANGYIMEISQEQYSEGTGVTLYTKDEVDKMIAESVAELNSDFSSFEGTIPIQIKINEEDNSNGIMSLPVKTEELQQAISIMQLNADEGSKEIQKIEAENVLILIHAIDSRATLKNAAKKQADILNSKSENGEQSETESNGDA